jgi:NADPH:quinone reductase-like Zn-dependent oxidoreductase
VKAVVQDRYGPPDVLELRDIDQPTVGDDNVLIRVHGAGVHIGDWHVMTGMPYLLRIMGFGLRAPKARVGGTDVAGTVEAVGEDVTNSGPAMTCSAPAREPSPNMHVLAQASWPPSQRT